MANAEDLEHGKIPDHMPVVGSDGRHLGTVDGVEGEYIKLSRKDPEAGGMHHWLPLTTVAGLEGGIVRLSLPVSQAREAWLSEHEVAERITLDPASAASFGRPTDDSPHGSRGQANGGPKGQREHGQSGQASGPPGQTSFGVDRQV
jgi:hypothetical protein